MDNAVQSHQQKIDLLVDNIQKVIRGKHQQILYVITALIAKGHILLEDNPGLGKTVMAKALASSISTSGDEIGHPGEEHISFKRIQFTPDLLPMDLIGTHIFDDSKKDFVFKKGPLFTNVLLADEINRASPKVQSALLECMAENQITIGERTYPLEKLFFTIATQNPVEMEGTYPLPTAQLDRFFMKISFGYVSEENELDIYENYLSISKMQDTLPQVLTYSDIIALQREAEVVHLHPEITKAVRNIVSETRKNSDILLGASTRSGIIFLKCLRAFALVNNRMYVIEDDIKALAHVVLHHRLIFRNKDAKQQTLNAIVGKELERLARLKIQA
jgi:MoxR-like ATPase